LLPVLSLRKRRRLFGCLSRGVPGGNREPSVVRGRQGTGLPPVGTVQRLASLQARTGLRPRTPAKPVVRVSPVPLSVPSLVGIRRRQRFHPRRLRPPRAR